MNGARAWTKPLRRTMFAACAIVWACAFVATHVPAKELPGFRVGDKVLHVVGFLGLGAVFLLALVAHGKSRRRRVWMGFPVLLLYAAFDEITQPLVGRTAALTDWLSDAAGAALAIAAVETVLAMGKKSRRTQSAGEP